MCVQERERKRDCVRIFKILMDVVGLCHAPKLNFFSPGPIISSINLKNDLALFSQMILISLFVAFDKVSSHLLKFERSKKNSTSCNS